MSVLPLDPVIARLRVRSPRRDGADLRLDMARELSALALCPRNLAPSSILLVRRVELAANGLWKHSNELARARRQRAIQERMQELRDRARRPLHGVIDPSSEALLFADEAELIACLALQFAVADAVPPWWCQAVSRYFSTSSLFALLRSRVELLPAVFTLLDDWRVVVPLALKLAVGECTPLREALVRQRELRHLDRAIRLAPRGSEPPSMSSSLADADERVSRSADELVERESPAVTAIPGGPDDLVISSSPFEPWLGSLGRSLDPQRELLVGIALGVSKDPRTLGSRFFSRAVARWLADAARRESSQPAPPERTVGPSTLPTKSSTAASGEPRDLPDEEAAATRAIGATSSGAPGADATDAQATAEAEVLAQQPDANSYALEGDVSELGGVFMLINVMEHLGLPDCFEEQCHLGSSVGMIGTLEALARVMAGTRGEQLAHDPIWAMLAKLDGRDAQVPPRADGLRNPGDKLPAAWLAQLGDEALAPRATVRLAIEALRRAGWSSRLLDWLTLVTPFIGWRIARACALDSVDEAIRLLIDLPARIYVTESHIDVVTSIENIRVPVRLAGLDRSPGWVRSMQRVVLFHFE
jgi:hypothetical protein